MKLIIGPRSSRWSIAYSIPPRVYQSLLDITPCLCQSLLDTFGVFAPGSGEKGLAPAAALDILAEFADDVAGVQVPFGDQVFGNITG